MDISIETSMDRSVKSYLKSSADLISKVKLIITQIHNFCQSKDKNPKDKFRWQTPLHLAARKGHLTTYKSISAFVVDKNPKDRDDLTPLHLAAENGHIAICEFILNNVVYKNPHNKTGWTPLHWAAGKGKFYAFFITVCSNFFLYYICLNSNWCQNLNIHHKKK